MPGIYTIELDLLGVYSSDMPGFEIWSDGILDSSYSISSTGTSISLTVGYSGETPTSLEFLFNDALGEAGRTIEIQSVKINDKYVNVRNFLSSESISQGESSVIDLSDAGHLFQGLEPDGSAFSDGATQAFDTATNQFRDFNGTADQIFDMFADRDTAYLGAGNDQVNGGAGDDILRGGAGNDLLYGGSGDDRLYGEEDNDTLFGGDGNDRIHGNEGNDDIFGNDGNDVLVGHVGDDLILGGNGNDKLNGGDGNDFLFGEDDDDSLIGGAGEDTLDGGSGNDLLYGGGGDDIMHGGEGDDILAGQMGLDIIHGNEGDDVFYLSSNDFVSGEQLYGDEGNDRLILSNAMMINLTEGIFDSIETFTGSNGDDTVTFGIEQVIDGFENIDLGGGTDSVTTLISGTVDITGSTLSSFLNAESGILTGSAGNDSLTLTGTQLDVFLLGSGSLDFNGGTDTLNITSTSIGLNLFGTALNSSITGLEVISASTANAGTTISVAAQNEAFTLTGSNFADILTGGSGNDTINGGNGSDILTGGGGNDILSGGAGNDTLSGGSGSDTADYRTATSAVSVDLSTTLAQNTGGAGTDTLTSIENIFGSNYNDTLSGNNAANTLSGGNGNDTLEGMGGNDTLTGGAGADTFIFASGSVDTVTDFSVAQGDVLDISNIVTGFTAFSDVDDFVQLQSVGGNTNILVDGNGNSGGSNFQQVGSLIGVTGLNAQSLHNDDQLITGGGGKVLCGHYFSRGMLPADIYAADLYYADKHFNDATKRGYRIWAVPLTSYLNKHPGGLVEKAIKPLVISWAKEMAYRTGMSKQRTIIGKLLLDVAVPVVSVLGKFIKDTDYTQLDSEKHVKEFFQFN